MGKKYLTVRKRRKNERNVLASKKQNIKIRSDCSNQQSNKIVLTGPSYSDNREDHGDNFQYDLSDSDSSEDHSQNSEQHNDEMSSKLSSSGSSEPPDYEVQQILPSTIDLDPDCCRRSLVDMEENNWKFSFHTLEPPDINSIGIDREVMTIRPVSDPFHYMSMPVLSFLGLFLRTGYRNYNIHT